MEKLSEDADFEQLMIDGNIVRVHQHGVAKKQHKTLKPWENPEVD